MMPWPRIDVTSGETVVPPALWLDLSAASGEAADARPVEMASSPVPAAPSPPLDPATPQSSSPLRFRRRTRLLAAFALLVSTGLHAAVLTIFLDRLSRADVEAETDAVSIEIVLEAPPSPTVAASGGPPAETQPETTDTEAAPPEIAPKEIEPSEPEKTAPSDQREEEIAAAAPDPIETEPADMTSDAPVEQPTPAPVEQASAAPTPPNGEPPARAQPPVEQHVAIRPRDSAAELTPPLPMPDPAPEVLPPEPAFAQAPPPEVDAPVPSPRPAYHIEKAEPEKRKKATVATQPAKPAKKTSAKAAPPAKSKAAQKPRKQAEETARSTASSAGSASARGGASAGAVAKYGQKLLSHVQRHKRYPEAAARQKITGTAKLAITIDRSGKLAGARVASGSGHAILDDEAVAVARRAAPYPRPPEGVGGNTISFSVTLRFTRR